MCLGIVLTATSCGDEEESTSTGNVPTTLTLLGITGETTDAEMIEKVEDALNGIFTSRYKIKIDLRLVTADEYVDYVKEQLELAQYYETYDKAITTYNTYIQKQANASYSAEKIFGNWIKKRAEVNLETLETRLLYTAEQTTVHENGKVETVYPDARSPIDIVMIADEEMYDLFDEWGLLNSIDPTNSSYIALQKYIYPTYFAELSSLKGAIKAIPNNNLLSEYTYLLVDKELANEYDFNINTFSDYDDLADFLAKVKENESVVPFAEQPDALGIFYTFSEDVAIGTYFDPINGYDSEEEGSGFEIKNLFEIEEYVAYLELMEEYKAAGYFNGNAETDGYAVKVITGDASIAEIYAAEDSKYDVKVIQNPFVLREAVFDGMLAPTVYSSDRDRAMQIIEAINTDSEVKNLLQYGIEGVTYEVNDDGSVTRLNDSYIMNNALTGNVYMGYLEEGMGDTEWLYVQRTNLASSLAPNLVYPVDASYIEDNLGSILKRAALSQALGTIGLTYDEYKSKAGTSTGNTYGNTLKQQYKEYFLEQLVVNNQATEENAENVFNSSTPAFSWYEDIIAQKIINEEYSDICTESELKTLIQTKMCSPADLYSTYKQAREDASKYYSNIENLRIIAKLTVFADMSEEEYEEKYNSLNATNFETAVYEYLKANYVEENNLTDEAYETLVQDFIASSIYKWGENNAQIPYTWEEIMQIKEDAQLFSEPMSKVRTEYNQLLLDNGFTQEQIDKKNDIEIGKEVIAAIRAEFYRANNHTASSYKTGVCNKILAPFNLTYDELNTMQRKDKASYSDYMNKIKGYYKDILLATMTKDEYNALTVSDAWDAIIEYYLENYTQAYAQMCEAAGITYKEYVEYSEYMKEYINVATNLKSTFIYTLRTFYQEDVVSAFTPNEVVKYVYEVVYNSGYYMNQVATTLGSTLSDYNSAKSKSTKYTEYLNTLLKAYSGDLALAGYDVKVVETYFPEEIEEILSGIVEEKYFLGYLSIEEIVAELSADYLAGIEKADDIKAYCKESADALNNDHLYNALVSYLNENLQSTLSK